MTIAQPKMQATIKNARGPWTGKGLARKIGDQDIDRDLSFFQQPGHQAIFDIHGRRLLRSPGSPPQCDSG